MSLLKPAQEVEQPWRRLRSEIDQLPQLHRGVDANDADLVKAPREELIAGYNAFWEARYFGKEACFAPFPRHFEDQYHRVRVNSDYVPKENGADELVKRLLG